MTEFHINGTAAGYQAALSKLDRQSTRERPTFVVKVDRETLFNLAHLFCWLQDHDEPSAPVGYQEKHCQLRLEFPVGAEAGMAERVKAFLASPDWYLRLDNREDVFPNNPWRPQPGSVGFSRILPLLSINRLTAPWLAGRVDALFDPNETGQFAVQDGAEAGPAQFVVSATLPPTIRTVVAACAGFLFGRPSGASAAAQGRAKQKLEVLLHPSAMDGAGRKLFKRVARWPVLAFLLWAAFDCAADRELRGRAASAFDADEWLSNLSALEPDTLDTADSLLELIENIVLHAGRAGASGQGVMALRVHRLPQAAKAGQDPLRAAFPLYFDGRSAMRLMNSPGGRPGGDELDPDLSSDDLRQRQGEFLAASTPTPPEPGELQQWARNLEGISQRRATRSQIAQFLEVRLIDRGTQGIAGRFRDQRKDGQPEADLGLGAITDLRAFFDPSREQHRSWRDFSSQPRNAVNHYGLHLFGALLASLDGAAEVASGGLTSPTDVYSSSGDDPLGASAADQAPIGTQYSLLIPLRPQRLCSQPLAHANVDFRIGSDLSQAEAIEVMEDSSWEDFREALPRLAVDPGAPGQQPDKPAVVEALAEKAPSYEGAGGQGELTRMVILDLEKLNSEQIEVAIKALLLWLHGRSDRVHLAIRALDPTQFRSAVHRLAVFFDRSGRNPLLTGSQVYVAGDSPGDEFWLPDAHILSAIMAQLKLRSAPAIGGTLPSALADDAALLLTHRSVSLGAAPPDPQALRFFPFDLTMPAQPGGNETIFDRNAGKVLNGDIQDPHVAGCKLNNAHVRLGSKVHLDAFYDAHLLFGNHYYVERYAWLVRQIMKQEGITPDTKALIVGNETYSETLIRRLIRQAGDGASPACWDYGIYEVAGSRHPIRWSWGEQPPKDQYERLVYLVPVSSTLTTFRKIGGQKLLKSAPAAPLIADQGKANPVLITLINVRHRPGPGEADSPTGVQGPELPFYEAVDSKRRTITTQTNLCGKTATVHYVHTVRAAWMDPLSCPKCFPAAGQVELPLADASRSPVVLSQLFGRRSDTPVGIPRGGAK
ncbi:MAG: hypothetical protein LBD97_01070 [Bifidobacteriaceae bacterium]|jgi:hypothetical protein|nr:hypothetical protein [Bifidobacteriaceae bacterium]